MNLLTNSRMACARSCLRKCWIRYELGIVPEHQSQPLRIGTAFHLAQETYDVAWKGLISTHTDRTPMEWIEREAQRQAVDAVRASDLDPYEQELVVRLFIGYRWFYQDQPLEAIATELQFDLPLVNPETGGASTVWRRAGKIDRISRLPDGRLAKHEYKTTSDDIAPDSDYWVRLRLDQQVSLYFDAARDLNYDVQTVLYDVTRKPQFKPSQVPLVDSDGVKIVHDANGERVRTKDGKKWRETGDSAAGYVLQTRPETPDEFGERITNDIVARPDHYFRRVEIPRLESDLVEFRHELWQQQLSMRACQRTGHWFRSTTACVTPYPCDYLNICHRTDLATVVPDGFKKLDNVHPELAIAKQVDPANG